MTDVGRCMTRRAQTVVVLSLAWLAAGCGSTDAFHPGPPEASAPRFTAQAPVEASGGVGCGADLSRAVLSRSPGLGEIAVDRCEDGWAYLGAAQGRGDTEQLWRTEDGAWRWVTSMPSLLCPVDLLEILSLIHI